MCSRTSTGQAHRTVQPKRSTDASSTSAAPPSGSATSPTTSPDPYSRPAASDPYYTVNCEEPEDIDAHALHRRGWTISAIARHLGRDRKTIRSYLTGDRQAGVRARGGEDRFERFVPYVTERLREDPHLWAMTLFDELVELGFHQSYPTLTCQ